jgi:hypothetical protein
VKDRGMCVSRCSVVILAPIRGIADVKKLVFNSKPRRVYDALWVLSALRDGGSGGSRQAKGSQWAKRIASCK